MSSPGSPHPVRGVASGSRPEGTAEEREAAARVRAMFSGIAPRYDFLNRLLSLSFDRLWRRRTARRFAHILARSDARVLDICCGTGDLALALGQQAVKETRRQGSREAGENRRAGAAIIGSDFAHPMLLLAKKKSARGHGISRADATGQGDRASPPEVLIAYVEADALALPFADESFDLITAAFGFRNLANYARGLGEIFRLLKRGGEVGILEFAEPRGRVFSRVYRFYFTKILPRIGGAISGDVNAYAYLPGSVSKFPQPEELAAQMTHRGFTDTRFELWSGGIVALHTARKP